jgi:hypothetical protein
VAVPWSHPSPAASPTVVASASEAKTTAGAVRQFYPLDCAANAASWKWATCHDETKGFDQVLACATAARDEADATSARFPAAQPGPDPSCGGTIETNSRAFVELTAMYLDDLVVWLAAHRNSLAGPLKKSAFQDLDNDRLKVGMPNAWDQKYGGSDPAGVRFGWVNDIVCTKALYRCGLQDDDVCWVQKVASRLGAACDASIWDTRNPNAWLYDRATHERIQ